MTNYVMYLLARNLQRANRQKKYFFIFRFVGDGFSIVASRLISEYTTYLTIAACAIRLAQNLFGIMSMMPYLSRRSVDHKWIR